MAAKRRRSGTADGCWILFRLGRIFALCSFLNSKSDVGMVAARGAHAIECAHARRVIRGWMGREGGREGWIEARKVESFRSLLLYGDSMSRSTSDGDFEFLSHETRSKFAIVVIVVTRPSPARLFLCHCSRKSNASFPAAARLDVACTRAPADCRYADVP